MQIKIELPGDLREQIESFLAKLDEAMKRAPENRDAITTDIAELESIEVNVQNEITRLRPQAATNDSAAVKINTKETRLREITARLEELRGHLNDLRPVTLQGAAAIVAAVFQHYATALPEAIADELKPICPSRHKAIFLAKLSEAWSAARGLRNWSDHTAVNPPVATPENVTWLKAILNRALEGQPHLGVEAPAAPEAAEVAQ